MSIEENAREIRLIESDINVVKKVKLSLVLQEILLYMVAVIRIIIKFTEELLKDSWVNKTERHIEKIPS